MGSNVGYDMGARVDVTVAVLEAFTTKHQKPALISGYVVVIDPIRMLS